MILKMLHQLRLLSFQFCDANTRLPKWDRLSSELKLSLLRLFQSPNLEICHLRGIELPFNFFDTFRSVRHLSLSSISMETFPVLVSNGECVQDGPDLQQNPRPSKNIHLASLELWNCCLMPFKPIRASLDLSQLREVSIQSQSPDIVWEAIKDTTLLESLTWDIRHHHSEQSYTAIMGGKNTEIASILVISEQDEPFDPGNIDLSLFPTLRILRIAISSFCYERDPLPWLIRSLKDIELAAAGRDDASKLEEISLHIGCHSSIIKVSVLSSHSIWTDLDKLLTTSPTFHHLRKFKIYVFHASIPNILFSGWDMTGIVPMMCSSLPSLRRRGILYVEPTSFTLKQILSAGSSLGQNP